MTAIIPDSYRDLLDDPVHVVATTIMPDGQPQSSVVWWDSDGEYVRINTTLNRQKPRNLERNPRITIMAVDPTNPLRWMEVRGVVESMIEEGAHDHIDALAQKYSGQPYFGGYNKTARREDQRRVTVNIRPTRVVVYPHPH